MEEKDIVFLSQVYNTLLTISTKGQDTLTMANCLNCLRNFIEEKSVKEIEEHSIILE